MKAALAIACMLAAGALLISCGGTPAMCLPDQCPQLSVVPSEATLEEGAAQQFYSTAPATWMVLEGSAGGTITPAGLYTAPMTLGTFHVVARSAADPVVAVVVAAHVVTSQ